MPSAIVKNKLSNSTDGRGIKVAATATPGTALHTAQTGTTAGSFDEVWIYAVNTDTASHTLTLQFGGTTSPDDDINIILPPNIGLVCVIPGLILQNGDLIKAFADTTNVVCIFGYVNTITA